MPATLFCNRCGFASADDAQFCQACGVLFSQPGTPVPVPFVSVAPTVQFAGFGIRVAAALVDIMLLLVVVFPIRMLVGSAVTAILLAAQYRVHTIMLVRSCVRIVSAILLGVTYRAGMESSIYQATLGKIAMRLKVTDLEGGRISLGRAVARCLSKWLSTATFGIGYLMVAFDEQKQGLHDRIAGTFVLRKSPSEQT